MLKALNLKKQYKPKDGVVVNALDDVSIDFSDTGMVFILGKSGSGKSTLLNVLGGLDKYDSGEVIVKGKSSKDFSQADFDSYRNTFIGFIFQEYNILQEFSVEKNIGLALELQGKKADKEAINELMEKVDLKGYGKRKPNTLSGGQKQRVAIARALVKNPEIIMADEPTGALDSKTGAQVLDTLKKLSKEKLVIIVSHDREFAEYYADRIIELADGKIISDQYKHEVEPKKSNGLEIVDDKVLTIKKGTKLDNAQLDEINSFLLNQDDDVIISVDNKANKEFKKFARINDEGQKETFKETTSDDVKLKDYDGNVKLIRSKLPMKDSIKMGASGLKTKRFRLVLTILLSVAAFGLFGLADTMGSYNKVDNTVQSLKDSNIQYAIFEKKKKVYYDDGTDKYYLNRTMLNDEDYNMLNDKFNMNFVGVYSLNEYGDGGVGIDNVGNLPDNKRTLFTYFAGATEATSDELTKFGSLNGNYPASYDELVITEYTAKSIITAGYKDVYTYEKEIINNTSDLIDRQIRINGRLYTIKGILDTHFDYSRYQSLDDDTQTGLNIMLLQNELNDLQGASIHTLAYMKDGFYNTIKNSKFVRNNNCWINTKSDDNKDFYIYINGIGKIEDFSEDIYYLDGTKTTLNTNEMLLELNDFNNVRLNVSSTFFKPSDKGKMSIGDYYWRSFKQEFRDYCRENNKYNNLLGNDEILNATIQYYAACNNDETMSPTEEVEWSGDDSYFNDLVDSYNRETVKNEFESFLTEYREKTDGLYNRNTFQYLANNTMNPEFLAAYNSHDFSSSEMDFNNYVEMILNAIINGVFSNDSFTANEKDIALAKKISGMLINSVKKFINYDDITLSVEGNGIDYKERIYKIVGFHYSIKTDKVYSSGDNVILNSNDELYKIYTADSGKYFLMLGEIKDNSTSGLKKLVEFNYDESGNYVYELRNNVMNSVNNINEFIETAAKIFLYIGIGFAVFASLLLLNFITVSISYKKREIGILRAIGARGMDVFKIFFSEAFIIALINFILAFIGCFVACYFINRMFRTEYGFLITILHVGIRQLLLMFGVSFVVAFVSSFIPVYLTARKKPIDAIRSAE